MIYPKFLKEYDSIGIIAPSDGVTNELKKNRLDNAIKNLKLLKFNIVEGKNIRNSVKGRSGSVVERLNELYDMYNNPNVKMISSVSGGDYLIEILDKLDYEVINKNTKWIQGYSDPTGILYTITTKLDIATIYGNNFCSYGMEKMHKSLQNNIEILKGNIIKQNSFQKYENGYSNYITGLEEYRLDRNVKWININNKQQIKFNGRVIGGCTDVLLKVVNTKFDYTKEFIKRYCNDKIIWYFDNYDITEKNIFYSLSKFNEAGWFKNIGGILFGRNTMDKTGVTKNFMLEVQKFLIINNINIDVIFDVDIGHKPPQLTIINGSLVDVISKDNEGQIITYLR